MVMACDFSSGPFHAWYAPSAVFYNGGGQTYAGGETIWAWIHDLFGPFEKMGELSEQRVSRLIPQHGSIAEASEGDTIRVRNVIVYEHVLVFYLKDEGMRGEGIPVRRMMEFVVGPSEIEGQGTDGLQIWQGKVWWDTAVLAREVEKRKRALALRGGKVGG
ncbi:hypothetical protein MMC20_006257 [Loxospora ochrophaea]|nr:hypothetical protein [Loxospora ochrophaea]